MIGKKSYELSIAGVTYKVKSSLDEQTVHQLVSYVDEKINESIVATKSGSLQNASVLAALNIAEEYLLLKKKAQVQMTKLESKALKLAQDIENTRPHKAQA